MANSITWEALAARCEASTGLDVSIDGEIFALVEPRFRDGRFTRSLDATVSLIERELPGWGFDLVKPVPSASGKSRANVFLAASLWCGQAYSPALALRAAFCRAMEAKEKEAGE
jgi:hypothetical protein